MCLSNCAASTDCRKCSDNEPEFLGEVFTEWTKNAGMAIQYIQPGTPNQNADIELFNRT